MSAETGAVAKPIDPGGQLYQRRALGALPILVRQATAGHPIYYSAIAKELLMDNPRNMNFVLGSVGTSLRQLSKTWNRPIPQLQALVIKKGTELPGEGSAEFAPDPDSFRKAPLRVKRQIVYRLLAEVYNFPHRQAVLNHFGAALLPPPELAKILPPGQRRNRGRSQ